MVNSPYKDCINKTVTCHSTCEKYNLFLKEHKSLKAKIEKIRHEENMVHEMRDRRIRKIQRRKGIK